MKREFNIQALESRVMLSAAGGSLYGAFGGGIVRYRPISTFYPRALATQSDGKVLVGGGNGDTTNIVRFDQKGKVDKAVSLDIDFTPEVTAIAIQADGKVVVAAAYNNYAVVERLTKDLAPDKSFGTAGQTTFALPQYGVIVRGIAIGRNGKINVAGTISDPEVPFFARLTSGGKLDNSYGDHGITDVDLESALRFNPFEGMALLNDGSMVVAQDDFTLFRVTPQGDQDMNFGGVAGGLVKTNFGGGSDVQLDANAMTEDANGKILIAGVKITSQVNAHEEIAIARYNGNGTLDRTFGSGGKSITRTAFSQIGVDDVAVSKNGAILVTGNTPSAKYIGPDHFVARLSARGTLDTTFGKAGFASVAFHDNPDRNDPYSYRNTYPAALDQNGHLFESLSDIAAFTAILAINV